MMKRLITSILVALALVIGVPNIGFIAAQQHAAADGGGDGVGPPNIEAGLCVGASLDFSAESQARCVRQTQPSNKPVLPPSSTAIQQGLCVGASLDLSYASWANCVRQVGAGTIPPPPPAPHTHTKPHRRPMPPPMMPSPATYAALGDSVAAGLGLSMAADGETANCGRSAVAYPNLVASARNLSLNDIACTGATAGDLITPQHINGPNPPPQIDQAFASGTPGLITITAGANDVHWDAFLRKCFDGTCGTSFDAHTMSMLQAALKLKLASAFANIDQLSNGHPPRVIITGYFNPVSPACVQTEPRLTANEITWISSELDTLNQTIETSTNDFSFVTFVPIDFTGHDICSSRPWVQSLNDPAPFHPTAQGQQVIAESIL